MQILERVKLPPGVLRFRHPDRAADMPRAAVPLRLWAGCPAVVRALTISELVEIGRLGATEEELTNPCSAFNAAIIDRATTTLRMDWLGADDRADIVEAVELLCRHAHGPAKFADAIARGAARGLSS